MDLHEFLTRLLPPAGRYVTWRKVGKYPEQKSYPTLPALHDAIKTLDDSSDVYYATAAFDPESDGREAEEVIALKAHRIDIDAGAKKYAKHGDKVYRTREDALRDLKRALKEGLPSPTLIVASGDGLHVYWELKEAVSPDEWLPTAEALKALCAQLQVRQDAGVTADAARILRPVGSLHNNGNRVKVLADSRLAYDNDDLDAAIRKVLKVEVSAPTTVRNINDDILNSIRMPPASLAKIAEHCGAVAQMRDTQGNVPEPLWRLIIGLAKFCETDGKDLVHTWSRGYDGYDQDETQSKYDRWDTPPPLCKSFAAESDKCQSCKHWGVIATPKQLGYVQQVEEPRPLEAPAEEKVSVHQLVADDDAKEVAPVPHRPDLFRKSKHTPYHVVTTERKNRVLMREVEVETEDDTGAKIKVKVDKPVAWRAFWVESATVPGELHGDGSELLMGRLVGTETPRIEYFKMPAELMGDAKRLGMFLFSQGINLAAAHENSAAAVHAQDFVRMDARRVQENMRLVIRDHFGYRFHEGKLVCSQGAHTVYPDGTIKTTLYHDDLAGVADALRPSCLPASSSGQWDAPGVWNENVRPALGRYFDFLQRHYGGRGYEIPRLALALGLASPLMPFMADTPFTEATGMPALGLVVTLYSKKSGSGKSTLKHVIANAFGQSGLVRSGSQDGMTEIAGLTLASTQSIYPFLLDEVTNDTPQRLVKLVYQYGNGEARIRARNTGAVVRPKSPFSCITLTSTNVPQRDLLAQVQRSSDATQMRILELSFEAVPQKDGPDRDAFRDDFKVLGAECAGAFGLYLALMTTHLGVRNMNEVAAKSHAWANQFIDMPQEYRFFVKALGALHLLSKLMGKRFPFDMEELSSTFRVAVLSAKAFLESQARTPQDSLEQMIAELAPSIVVTKSWGSLINGQPVIPLNPDVRQPLAGREVQDEGAVYLSADAIRKWCIDRQLSPKALLEDLTLSGMLTREGRKMRITSGIANMVSQVGRFYRFKDPRAAEGTGGNVTALRPQDLSEDEAA